MDSFNITNPAAPLQIQVNVKSNYEAFTSVYLMIGNSMIKPAVAESEVHENGCIDLDAARHFLWKSIGLANTFQGNSLLCITTIYNLPGDLDTNEKMKGFVLKNIGIDYDLGNDGNTDRFVLDQNDMVVTNTKKTATIYKKIQTL